MLISIIVPFASSLGGAWTAFFLHKRAEGKKECENQKTVLLKTKFITNKIFSKTLCDFEKKTFVALTKIIVKGVLAFKKEYEDGNNDFETFVSGFLISDNWYYRH